MAQQVKLDKPYIDLDEMRTVPHPHRYLHGGFKDTDARFSFYFLPKKDYEGRFVQYLQGGGGGSEMALSRGLERNAWLFDLAFTELGAYLVESNQGHMASEAGDLSTELVSHLASAASARYARKLAAEYYGKAPKYGYVGGPSGGGARSLSCLEHAPDVYNGAVPHVAVVHTAMQYSVWAHTALMLGEEKITRIVDAAEPGGSGEIFAGLNHAERTALAEMYRFGWPRRAESQMYASQIWYFGMGTLDAYDHEYFDAFWSEPGYLGHDRPEMFKDRLVSFGTRVKRVVSAGEALPAATLAARGWVAEAAYGVELDIEDASRALRATVRIEDGAAAGRELWIAALNGKVLLPFGSKEPKGFQGVQVGDRVTVDNHDFLAFTHYYRYGTAALPEAREPGATVIPEFYGSAVDGKPAYPQRPPIPGPQYTIHGKFPGKMILCQGTHDPNVWPTKIVPYARMVEWRLGAKFEKQFRLWWMENATHGNPETFGPTFNPEKRPAVWTTRLIDYSPIIRQGFRDLVTWVEKGIPAPASTAYTMTSDNELVIPATAKERGGVQAVVTVTVNGGVRADVKVGQRVTLAGSGVMPPGTGSVVSAEWDFEGIGTWPRKVKLEGAKARVDSRVTFAYAKPGTYFATFRVGSHRRNAKGMPIYNLARVRVVVS